MTTQREPPVGCPVKKLNRLVGTRQRQKVAARRDSNSVHLVGVSCWCYHLRPRLIVPHFDIAAAVGRDQPIARRRKCQALDLTSSNLQLAKLGPLIRVPEVTGHYLQERPSPTEDDGFNSPPVNRADLGQAQLVNSGLGRVVIW